MSRGGSREPVAAALAAGRGHQLGPAQVADDVLAVGVRQLLAARDLADGLAALVDGAGQRDEDADAVFGAGGDLHDASSSRTRTSSPTTSVG